MDNFLLCFHAITPLLLLMLLGYGLKRSNFIPAEGFSAMDKLSFHIFIPAMLFHNVYNADFSSQFHLKGILFMELGILGVFLAAFLLVPRLLPNRNADIATVIHGISHGNLAVLGMPLILNLFGSEQAAVYSILMACSSPLINPLMVFNHVYFQGDKIHFRSLLRNIFTSPFLVGTLLGLGCNLLRIRFPVFLNTTISNLKSIATPLCLISLGGSFSFGQIREFLPLVLHSVLTKCVWIPAVILSIAVALGFRGLLLASLLVVFCCPSATATYSFCTGYCGNPKLASQIVVYSTLFSIFSMFCWLFAFLQLGLI